MCVESEQKNPVEKPFKFCMRRSVMLCAECEQKNPIEKPFKFCMRRSVMLCAECGQKNSIEKPFIRRSVTLYAKCERYTGYSLVNKAFVYLRTRGSIMANDVRREANENRLRRRRERDKIEEREKPVKKDAQGSLNSACITHFPHLSHLAY